MATDVIIDTNSIYARAWYGVQGRQRECIVTTLQLALMCLDPKRVGENIDRVLFCWDAGQKKAKERVERPKEYEDTKEYVKGYMQLLWGAHSARIEPYEADDLIATAATHSTSDHVIIATGDKDLCQLSSDRISIFDVAAKGMIGRREILSRWHIKRPLQLAITLAIQGDSSDNIKGIKGWGRKKAQVLFEAVTPDMDFETALGAIVDQIPASKLDDFYEALGLTLLDCDIPDVPEPQAISWCKPKDLTKHDLAEIFDHYAQVYGEYFSVYTPRMASRED
jgi:5'-3' exonuclease